MERQASTLLPLFTVCFVVFLLPMLLRLPEELRSGYSAEKDRLEVLHEIKRIVPQEVNPYDKRFLYPDARVPELKSAHSVMAFWSQGHLVTYFSERPVVANNFGFGFMDSLNFFFAKSEEEALAIAQRRRVRYVFSLDIFPVINQYSRVVGQPDYLLWTGEQWKTDPAYFQTLQARLHDFDGKGGQIESGIRVEPLRSFHLRFSSQTAMLRFGKRISKFKIFEIVR